MKHVALKGTYADDGPAEGTNSQDNAPPATADKMRQELARLPVIGWPEASSEASKPARQVSRDGSKCTVELIRDIIRARLDRELHFPAHLFADPAWDMLLDLYAADLAQVRVTITSLSAASNVPMTTALRWISSLEREGLIRRHNDPLDARRYFMSLTDAARRGFEAYFSGVPGRAAVI